MTTLEQTTPADEARASVPRSGAVSSCNDLLHGNFRVVLADPPWDYGCKSPTASARPHGFSAGCEYYYETMKLSELCAMPVAQMVAPDSCLFLWSTTPLLPEALEVMKAWGFRYKTKLTWYKENGKGMGYWFRGMTEDLLLGVRGDVKAFRSQRKNHITEKVGRHSAKPQQFHELIEEVCPGPRLELFGRIRRPGWRVWGDQVETDLLSV